MTGPALKGVAALGSCVVAFLAIWYVVGLPPLGGTEVQAPPPGQTRPERAPEAFDHGYANYAALLGEHVRGPQVDYARLVSNRADLDRLVSRFGHVDAAAFAGWTRDEQIAYLINAYNLYTLRAIVDHYPIKGSFFSLHPRNSIRQIDGVWDELTWRAAGRTATLDQIEHEILRPVYEEPRVHFAVNCASVSCPPLRPEPYVGSRLDDQLDRAARDFLAGSHGLVLEGRRLSVSSIFKWYGDDFIARYADSGPAGRAPKERAILGTIIALGPAEAASAAKAGDVSVRYLDYDWSLNDATEGT